MKLRDLGERRIIEVFQEVFGDCGGAVVGIGDDAAVFPVGDRLLVVSTDMVAEGTHIPKEMTPRQIGKYAAAVNLSDIAAMGARPFGMVFSFGLPGGLDEGFVTGVAEGIREACTPHGVCILGGDTKESAKLVITGTALGEVEKDRLLTRSGARPGDLICVTGSIGSAAAGFYCLTRGIEGGRCGDFIKAALEPEARIQEGLILSGYATSCMDISDGLAYSLGEIAGMSGVGFLVREDAIPVEEGVEGVAAEAGVSPRELVFHKGGDFELLFTVAGKDIDVVKSRMEELGTPVTVIGEVIEEGYLLQEPSGETVELETRGYQAFLTKI
ncbi:MAG: thiamine-phosphate kinase [Euryarchaeota archaeon]|nr:thiamine-phosphate kinase [Euryarchaeota archaeon]